METMPSEEGALEAPRLDMANLMDGEPNPDQLATGRLCGVRSPLRCPDSSAVRLKNLCRGEWPGRSTFGEWELGIGCNTAKCDVARCRSIADELGDSTEAPKQLRKAEEERSVAQQKDKRGSEKEGKGEE